MDIITNPLFGVVTLLLGILLGYLVGRRTSEVEWAQREKLMRETFQATRSETGCWVKGQIDVEDNQASE